MPRAGEMAESSFKRLVEYLSRLFSQSRYPPVVVLMLPFQKKMSRRSIAQNFQLTATRSRLFPVKVPCTLCPARSRRALERLMSFSFMISRFGRSGVPGRTKNPRMPTGIVMMAQMMYIHLHPARPLTPSRLADAPAWIRLAVSVPRVRPT